MSKLKYKTNVRKHRRKGKKVRAHSRSVTLRAPIFEDIAKELKRGKDVSIPQFGKFKIKRIKARKARPGRNPFTGENIMLKAKPASKKIKFNPYKTLRRIK